MAHIAAAARRRRRQVWREDGHALFQQLKKRAAGLMEDIAASCDERYAALCREPAGPALVSRFPEAVQLLPVAGCLVSRQDSDLVPRPPPPFPTASVTDAVNRCRWSLIYAPMRTVAGR